MQAAACRDSMQHEAKPVRLADRTTVSDKPSSVLAGHLVDTQKTIPGRMDA